MLNQRVGSFENGVHRAVVLLQLDELEHGVILAQKLEVFRACAAPGVHRLVIVAHSGQVGAHIQQMAQQGILCRVGVLHFIHQQITHAQPPLGANFKMLIEQTYRQGDQIVEVQRIAGAQLALVGGK